MTDNGQRATGARSGGPHASPEVRHRTRRASAEATFTARRSFACSAHSLWHLLARLDNPQLAKGFAKIAVEGAGEGAVRSLWLSDAPGAGAIRERIEAFDERSRAYTYRVFEFGPVPFKAYTGRLRVKAGARETCQLLYRARFVQADGVSVEDARAIARGGFASLCANIADALR